MTAELVCAKKNGNGNGEVIKPKPQNLPKEEKWGIKRDMPRPSQKESRKKAA